MTIIPMPRLLRKAQSLVGGSIVFCSATKSSREVHRFSCVIHSLRAARDYGAYAPVSVDAHHALVDRSYTNFGKSSGKELCFGLGLL